LVTLARRCIVVVPRSEAAEAQMSEERYEQIEMRLERLEGSCRELAVTSGRLGDSARAAASDIASLHIGVTKLRVEVTQLKADVGDIKAENRKLDTRIDALDRHMRVLHEDVLSRIAALGEHDWPTQAEMNQGFADLRDLINRRIDPLEAVLRNAIANGRL
jgi:chromosome segregation ATPase